MVTPIKPQPLVTDSKIIVALDYANPTDALALAAQLDPRLCKLKVGKELFTSAGPQFVEKLVAQDYAVFLDLKFHDIPNTVAKACKAATALGVWMLNVHASGGLAMMQAAREAVDSASTGLHSKPWLIAVTVLTSMDEMALKQVGIQTPLAQHVLNLARLTQQAQLDGVVCSAHEAPLIRSEISQDFCLVTPGIRPLDASSDDQSRIVTPRIALENGANYLVIGRPITQAHDPQKALENIYAACLET